MAAALNHETGCANLIEDLRYGFRFEGYFSFGVVGNKPGANVIGGQILIRFQLAQDETSDGELFQRSEARFDGFAGQRRLRGDFVRASDNVLFQEARDFVEPFLNGFRQIGWAWKTKRKVNAAGPFDRFSEERVKVSCLPLLCMMKLFAERSQGISQRRKNVLWVSVCGGAAGR